MIKIDNGLIVNDIYVPRPSTLAKAVKTQEFKDVKVTENGFYVITPDEGFGKMKQVNLNVDVANEKEIIPIYSASEAVDLIVNQGVTGDAYVYGQITSISDISLEYGNATYFLDDVLQIFRGRWFDGDNFIDPEQIKVGDRVTVFGNLEYYNSEKPQVSANNRVEQFIPAPNLGQLYADFEDIDGEGNYWRYAFDDGYDGFIYVHINGSAYGQTKYDEGYMNGVNDSSYNSSVVTVSDNNSIYTKYVGEPEWNEPLTGDDFYSYVSVGYACFDTGVRFNEVTSFEFWYRFTDSFGSTGTFWGYDNSSAFAITRDADSYANENGYRFTIRFGGQSAQIFLRKDEWYNFKYAENMFTVNGDMVGYFNNSSTSDKTVWFNGNNEGYSNNQEMGQYGMVKINDRVIIPDGYSFKWQDNDEYLPFVSDLTASSPNYKYFFEKIEKPVVIDGLIKEVNVDYKIDVNKYNLFPWKDTKMQKIPEVFDFSNVKSFGYAFNGNKALTDISALRTATKPIYSIENMFSSSAMVFDLSPLENWDVSECLNANFCFSNCQITDYSPLAKWNLSKCTGMSSFIQMNIYTTPDIIKIPVIRCDSVGSLSQGIVRFNASSAKCPVIEMGGFINIKVSLTQSDGIAMCPNLTYDSCINILNGLYDFTNNLETPTSSQGTLKVHQNFLDLVGDEINIGISKGWVITA